MTQRNPRRNRKSYPAPRVAAVLKEYRASGLTQSQFCREHEMPLWRLNRWLCRERQRRSKLDGQTTSQPELIQVALPVGSDHTEAGWPYELDWRKGQLRLGGDFDPHRVGQLLHLLGVC